MAQLGRVLNGEDIYEDIKRSIIRLELAPGQGISENEISKRYNVSRTPVKAAFLRLMSEGFIEIVPQRGTYVTVLDYERIQEIIFLRYTIESQIAHSIIGSVPPAHMARLESNLEEQRQLLAQPAVEPEAFYKLDSGFHNILFEAAGHPKLFSIIQEFQVYYTRFRMLDIIANDIFPTLLAEHERLLRLLREGDREPLDRLLHDHLYGNIVRLSERVAGELRAYFLPMEPDAGRDDGGRRRQAKAQ